MMDILAGLLKSAAPMLATAILGPAGGAAVAFLGDKLLGDSNASVPDITAAVRDADDITLRDLNAQYEGETKRLIAEQGTLDDLTGKVDKETASKISYLRMATRPEVVRMMAQYIMLPMYVMVVDGYLAWCNIWLTFFGHTRQLDLMASTFFDANSTYYLMYQAGVVPATTIVLSYMTLRQIEKSGNPLKSVMKMFGK